MGRAIPRELQERLAALTTKGALDRQAEMQQIVAEAMRSLEGDLGAGNLKVYAELETLYKFILAARQEIANLRPDEITAHHLPTATDELDAIVGATEQATNDILNAMEAVESVAQELPQETAQRITDAVTKVYEACNFQDITGQRITKVVKALKHIEAKVENLISALSPQHAGQGVMVAPEPEIPTADQTQSSEQALLNGPQLPDDAHNQAHIDALFSELD
ncbi:MAG TPA: protein phosphatase CheZ [Dongiaceae bacterium]|jgi:chemotaxis protein CheZ|nr:protein phosphatase CheZ [Dongiaceae bacterium]